MREEYIKMRDTNQFDIGWFYNYYKEKGGSLDFNVFQLIFRLNNDILKNLDTEYKLTIVQSKNGDFIKVVE